MPSEPSYRHLLVVVRHAEAEPSAPSDAQRPLTRAGNADAAAAGEWLASKGVRVHAAVVSAAQRARCTWEEMAAAAEWSIEPALHRALYEADTDTALDLVRDVREDARTVVVVGHNPTMAALAMLLDDDSGDVAASTQMAEGFPTCSLAAFSFDRPWADLEAGSARLRAFHVARA